MPILGKMPMFARTHLDARRTCCAGCGQGGKSGAKHLVTPTLEILLKKFAHPTYDSTVESYSVGL